MYDPISVANVTESAATRNKRMNKPRLTALPDRHYEFLLALLDQVTAHSGRLHRLAVHRLRPGSA
jgi:hypothetical protein